MYYSLRLTSRSHRCPGQSGKPAGRGRPEDPPAGAAVPEPDAPSPRPSNSARGGIGRRGQAATVAFATGPWRAGVHPRGVPAQNGIRPRACRPAEPLRPTARELELKDLPSRRPRMPGAFDPTRDPAPRPRWAPFCGCREKRGSRKASTARTTHAAITMPMTISVSKHSVAGSSIALSLNRLPRQPLVTPLGLGRLVGTVSAAASVPGRCRSTRPRLRRSPRPGRLLRIINRHTGRHPHCTRKQIA